MIGYPLDSHVTYATDGTPSYDRAINSMALRTLYNAMFSSGIRGNHADDLVVSSNGDMTVNVSSGLAIVNGCIKYIDTDETVTISAADSTFDRYDLVAIRLDANDSARSCDLVVLKGVAAAEPIAPSLTRTSTIYDIAIAQIRVVANATAILESNITDKRYDDTMCGTIKIFGDAVESSVSELLILSAALQSQMEYRGNSFAYDTDGNLSLVAINNDGTTNVLSTVNIAKAGSYYLDAPTNVRVVSNVGKVDLYWTDPSDTEISGETFAKWSGTRIVRKVDTPPTNASDGDVIYTETVRNSHTTVAFVDTTCRPGTNYYYGIFPYTDDEVFTLDTKVFAKPLILDTFSNTPFDDIKRILALYYAGDLEIADIGWNVGDTKTITMAQITDSSIGGSTYSFKSTMATLMIVGTEHDDIAGGNGVRTKAGFTCILLPNTKYAFKTLDLSVSGNYKKPVYSCTNFMTWANSKFMAAMPGGLVDLLKNISKTYGVANSTKTIATNYKVNVPSAKELYVNGIVGWSNYANVGGSLYSHYSSGLLPSSYMCLRDMEIKASNDYVMGVTGSTSTTDAEYTVNDCSKGNSAYLYPIIAL